MSCFLITIMNVLFVSTNVGVVTCFMEQSTPLVMCSHAVCNSYQFNSPDAGAEAAFAGEQCGFTLCTYSKYLKLLVQASAQRGSVA